MLLGLEDGSVGLIELVGSLLCLLIGLGVGFGFGFHALDLFVRESAGGLDTNLLLLAGSLVFGGDIQDTVSVDIKGHFNLRFAASSRHDAVEVEDTDLFVLRCHGAFALQHLDLHRGLVIHSGGEDLLFLGRDSGVGLNHLGHHATHGLDTEAQRSDIKQEHIFHFAGEYAALDGCAYGYYLIRVDALVGHFAEELLNRLLDSGDTG